MKRYSKYKDSGVEWIGEIPIEWAVKKLKYFARICNGSDYKEFVLDDGGYPVYGTGGVFARSSKYLYDKPSVLLGRKGSVETPQIVFEPFWTSDTSYYTEISKSVNPIYFFHLANQIDFKRYTYGSAIPSMTKSVYDEMIFPFPSKDIQDAIVRFLDDKTSQIDALISNAENKISLLKEKRTALINHVVTKGLDPNVKMKDSGVEWIGEIPEGWAKKQIKHLGYLYGGLTGKSGDDFRRDESDPTNKPFIPFTNICNNFYIDKNDLKLVSINEDDSQNIVQKYDLFVMMTSETQDDVGKTSVLKDDLGEVYLNTFCKGFRININSVDPYFLNYLLNGDIYRKLIAIEGNGYTRINLRQDRFSSLNVFMPQLIMQQNIVKYLDHHTTEIDKKVSLEERRIELLKEYRQSLISEVVTGKINVSDYA